MNKSLNISPLLETELSELVTAKKLLENPGIAVKITDLIGTPIEMGMDKLPKKWKSKLSVVTKDSLLKAANAAIFTMKKTEQETSSNKWHKFAVASSGAAGGFLGFAGLAFELPVSTIIMLRSIADIARSNGEDIDDFETKLACLEVFALGGKSKDDDNADAGYYAVRATLGRSISEASKFILKNGVTEEGAPILIKVIVKIAERFSIQVSEKFVAQTVPVIGAVGGALINTLFMDHFQDMAKGHFIVRRLEQKYGSKEIHKIYSGLIL